MNKDDSQAKILAQAVYEIRLLLGGYLGSQVAGDPQVRIAAHLAYALHNEALAVLEGSTFDASRAVANIAAVDRLFSTKYSVRFAPHSSSDR